MSPKWPKIAQLSWTIFFGTNHYYYFYLTVGPFHCAKFTNISYSGSKIMRMRHFLGPKWSICSPPPTPPPKEKIFWKLLLSFSSLPINPFHYAKLKKKSFHQILSYEDAQFLGPKWPICPNKNFFRKPVNLNLVPFIHAIYMPKFKVRY